MGTVELGLSWFLMSVLLVCYITGTGNLLFLFLSGTTARAI
uniref:Uncharacterized protein n=1 Tax=Arundo donax TaxID=35708 RepID=A0A0A9HM24_ARUDO